MIISRHAIAALHAAMQRAQDYAVSYPFPANWREPALQEGLGRLVTVEFHAEHADHARTPLPYALENPLVVLKRVVKAEPATALLMTTVGFAMWPNPTAEDGMDSLVAECHRRLTLDELAIRRHSMRGLIDAMVWRALSEAYRHHPAAEAFLAELADHYGWRMGEFRFLLDGILAEPPPVKMTPITELLAAE